jgi:hypothetical protein
MHQIGHLRGGHAHHGAPVGVEAHGHDQRQTGRAGALDRGLELLDRGDRLDPEHVGAALGQGRRLLGEGGLGVGLRQGTDRLQDLAGRAHGAGDDDLAPAFLARLTRQPGRGAVELGDPVLGPVQLEPVAGAAEGVGQDDVRAGFQKAAVQLEDALRVVDVPQLGRVAGLEPHGEVVGPRRAVGEQPGACFEQACQTVGHGGLRLQGRHRHVAAPVNGRATLGLVPREVKRQLEGRFTGLPFCGNSSPHQRPLWIVQGAFG